ncbi:hypothetical protein [Halobaculum sp. MBLA0143]|uniref:DUF7511 domain-containing protein n=1 Tax=Halobaculum sp. MBLA0143 TaxID=3079933 RepID=UPI003524EA25
MAASPRETETDTDRAEAAAAESALVGYLEPRSDGPDAYTVAPADADDADLVTNWLTVSADVLRDLSEMR